MHRLDVTVGEYRVIMEANGHLQAERNGRPWRDCVGDNLILSLASEIERLRKIVGPPQDVRTILLGFAEARLHGQQKYGGADPVAHDLQHTPKEWLLFIHSHLEQAQAWGVWTEDGLDHLIKAGGLILSAVWCAGKKRALASPPPATPDTKV